MPYESMPDLSELLREADHGEAFDVLCAFPYRDTLPATLPERVARSAAFVVALVALQDSPDPESAFRDGLREMMHAAVDFGINWTDEERIAWQDVRRERLPLSRGEGTA